MIVSLRRDLLCVEKYSLNEGAMKVFNSCEYDLLCQLQEKK